jgi:hypothetical protein
MIKLVPNWEMKIREKAWEECNRESISSQLRVSLSFFFLLAALSVAVD